MYKASILIRISKNILSGIILLLGLNGWAQQIKDTTTLKGYYVQAGYFFHNVFDWWPKHLEMAGRHAAYRPDNSIRQNLQDETTVAFNWFFKGHKNKLTSEFSYFSFQDKTLPLEAGWRFRIQWDISL